MATRPFIAPTDILEYTEYPLVKLRAESKLVTDIARAEMYIISFTNNKFEELEAVPEAVKTATLLLAESYAFNACILANNKKSETFDDYSYVIDKNGVSVDDLRIDNLLSDFIIHKPKNSVSMSMRRL